MWLLSSGGASAVVFHRWGDEQALRTGSEWMCHLSHEHMLVPPCSDFLQIESFLPGGTNEAQRTHKT